MLSHEVEYCVLDEFPSRDEGIRFLTGCSGSQLKKAGFPKKWLEQKNRKGETWRLPLDLVNHGKIVPEYDGPLSHIICESENFLAIHKPPYIHSHPQRYTDSNTALNALYALGRGELLDINSAHYDRSLLFRLDFETSGVLIFAKSEKAYQSVREDFNSKAKEKFYLAIVNGKFDKAGEHTHYLKASGVGGERQKVFETGSDQMAHLSVELITYSEKDNLSLLKVGLKTGLRHQIRAQLAHLGFPLLGDELYGGEKSERLYLHAYQYTLTAMNETFSVRDSQADLFDRFFDLHSTFKVL